MARLFFYKANIFLSHDAQAPTTATPLPRHLYSSLSYPSKTLFTLLLIAIANLAAAETRCDRPAATLESAEGAVEWTTVNTDDWQKAEAGATFCYGDKVRILEQRAALRLANDTLVRLQENSLITLLPEEKGFWFSLLEGAGHFLSRTPKQFTIKAPYLNAAVDGTEFVISAQPQENRVAVVEGAVRVSNDLGEVHLSEGTQTSATANSAPSAVQSIRLRDAAEWVLYYPPLIVQIAAPAAIETLIQQENYGAALSQLTATDLTAETAALAASLAYNTGNTAQGEQLLTQALNQSTALPETRALQALRTLIGGDSDGALVQTTQLVNTHPQNPSVLLAHAYAQQSRGKIEEALQTNLQAQALMPENLFVLARTAELQLSVGNTRAAQKLINTALKQAPQHSRLNTLAGFIALNRFATGKAQDHFQTAIASNNNEPLARLGLALAFIQKGKIEQGRAQMEMAVLLDPSSSLLRSYLGKTYATQNQNDWADTQYQLAKNLDPNDPTPWFYQALKKQQTGDLIGAVKSFEKSRTLNDNRAVYRSRLYLDNDSASRAANVGRIYNTLGFSQRAIDLGAKAISESPGEHSGHRLLAEVYAEDNRYETIRSSERLQATMLQPLGTEPLPLGLSETGLLIADGAGPADLGINEYGRLFLQDGLRSKATLTYGSQNTRAFDVSLGGSGEKFAFDVGHYNYKSDGFRENNDADYEISNFLLQWQPSEKLRLQGEVGQRRGTQGDLGLTFDLANFSPYKRTTEKSDTIRAGAVLELTQNGEILAAITHKKGEESREDRVQYPTGELEIEEDSSADSDIFDIRYTHRLTFGDLNTGAYSANIEISANDVLPYPAEYHGDQEIHEFYLYWNSRLSKTTTVSLGTDILSSSRMLTTAFGNFKEKISNQVLPKFGIKFEPFPAIIGQLAYYETYIKPLEIQTTLKPTHILAFEQLYDGATGTSVETAAVSLSAEPFESTTVGYRWYSRKFNQSIPYPGSSNFSDSKYDNVENRLYIHWLAHENFSAGGEYSDSLIERPIDPSRPLLSIPEYLDTQSIKLNLIYTFKNFSASLTPTWVKQDLKTEGSIDQQIETRMASEEFFILSASTLIQLSHKSSAKIQINNILNEELIYVDDNIFTSTPRSSKYASKRSIIATLTLSI
jgi:Flp pilus assembly protein TadD